MKKIFTILFLLFSLFAGATDYYVKTGGNDAAAGTSDGTAWASITKVNSVILNAGDQVLFRRGDTFSGTLIVTDSGTSTNKITIGAYGTGNDPVLSAFTTITGWTSYGGGIYYKALSVESAPNIVSVNGVNTAIGRYPDSGWLTIDSHVGTTSITDAALPSSPDWDGAEVVIRKNNWIIDRNTITSHSGTTINYTTASSWEPSNGNGYFVQNDLETLTAYGEWYYGSGNIYMYFGAVDPATVSVKISSLDQNINITGYNYITVSDLKLEGANESAIYISGSDYVIVENCIIEFCGDAGIDGFHNGSTTSLGFQANNNIIREIQNQGIILNTGFDGALIHGNTLDNVGLLPGHNFSGDGQNNGIKLHGHNHIVEYNKLTDHGYNGIDFGGNNVKVRYNFIDGFGITKDDVGAIYTTCFTTLWTGREIYSNVILNGYNGNSLSTKGIYADQREANLSIYDNTIYNCGIGIFLHNAHECSVTGNLVYKCYGSALWVQHDSAYPSDPTANLTINNNKFLSLGPPDADDNHYGYRFHYYTDVDANYNFGTADNNVVCRFLQETGTSYLLIKISGVSWIGPHLTFAQWKTNSGEDTNSTGNLGGTVTSESDLHFIYNDTTVTKTFTLSTSMTDPSGNSYSVGNITVSPYSSTVLIGSGTVTEYTESEPDLLSKRVRYPGGKTVKSSAGKIVVW